MGSKFEAEVAAARESQETATANDGTHDVEHNSSPTGNPQQRRLAIAYMAVGTILALGLAAFAFTRTSPLLMATAVGVLVASIVVDAIVVSKILSKRKGIS